MTQIGKLGRDMKKWKVWEVMKEKVEQFRQTMPLIQDLKNPALRERHWDALRLEVSKLAGKTGLGHYLGSPNVVPIADGIQNLGKKFPCQLFQ